jgi:hypothetical protein
MPKYHVKMAMLSFLLASALSITFPAYLSAQVLKPYALNKKNDAFAELLGPGVSYSLNYSRNIGNTVSLRAGAGTLNKNVLTLVMASKIFSAKNRTWWEAGTGPVLNWEEVNHKVAYFWWAGSLYYCHRLEDMNVYYRLGLCSVVGEKAIEYDDIPPFVTFGVGLGSRF